MRPFSFVSCWLIVTALSCQPPAQVPATPAQYSVPTELEAYVQQFREEAQKRGKAVATDNLIIEFGQPSLKEACGECVLEAGKTPRIILAKNASCWQQVSTQERECLVFHELGHCLLNRSHVATPFPSGAFVSLMNPADRTVYATCPYPIGNDECDKRPRRGYYVDELFNTSTPAPPWSR